MSSKKYKGRLCVYCSQHPSITGDHVFAREFFITSARTNLPKVPTCNACNNEKSTLEHYLTTVLPFGGRHADARTNLNLVLDRLAKNLRLFHELLSGRRVVWQREDWLFRRTMTIPIDAISICKLFTYIARALVWFHWQAYLTNEHDSEALMLSRFGQEYFDRLFHMNAAKRIHENLGNGTVTYVGAQAIDIPQLTIWRFQMYGGITFSGDPYAPIAIEIGAFTGPRRLVRWLAGRTTMKS